MFSSSRRSGVSLPTRTASASSEASSAASVQDDNNAATTAAVDNVGASANDKHDDDADVGVRPASPSNSSTATTASSTGMSRNRYRSGAALAVGILQQAGVGNNNSNNNSSGNKNGSSRRPWRRRAGGSVGGGDGNGGGGGGVARTSSGRLGSTGGRGSSRSEAAAAFHPKFITAQIVAMQCFHYFLLAFLFQCNNVFFGQSISIDHIFTDEYIRLWKPSGWPDVGATVLASLAGSVLLAIIVEKSKKCLDFSVTLFFLHLVLCTLYHGFPTVLDWWVVHIFGTIIMVLLGEYLCSRKELDDIPLLQL